MDIQQKLRIITLACLLLGGCRIDVVVEGQGTVSSPGGAFDCSHAGGDCSEEYDEPTTQVLVAEPAPGYAFIGWKGCRYRDPLSCTTSVSQEAIDNDANWTVTAIFEPLQPPVEPATYTYNALGQRITKTVGGITTVFQYDLQGRLIAELDSTGQPLREHIYLDGAPIAQVTTDTAAGTAESHYVHTDHLGTPTLLTDEQGIVSWDRVATPFGETYGLNAAVAYNLRFPGQFFDKETGLYYNYYRNYDPTSGRYIQSDPIGLADGLNTYIYASGNPLSYYDPYGLWCIGPDLTAAIAGAAGGATAGALAGGNPWTIAGGAALGGFASYASSRVGAGASGVGVGAITGGLSGGVSGAIGGTLAAIGAGSTGSNAVGGAMGGFVGGAFKQTNQLHANAWKGGALQSMLRGGWHGLAAGYVQDLTYQALTDIQDCEDGCEK